MKRVNPVSLRSHPHDKGSDQAADQRPAVLSQVPVGAHLVTPRRGYSHHGIYVGAGRVIHYAGFSRSLRRGPIVEVSLQEFTQGRDVRVRESVAPTFSGASCVERARLRLGEDRYRFLSNNCEHFAEWCVSGTSRSRQVEAWLMRIRRGLAGFGLLAKIAGVPSIARAELPP